MCAYVSSTQLCTEMISEDMCYDFVIYYVDLVPTEI